MDHPFKEMLKPTLGCQTGTILWTTVCWNDASSSVWWMSTLLSSDFHIYDLNLSTSFLFRLCRDFGARYWLQRITSGSYHNRPCNFCFPLSSYRTFKLWPKLSMDISETSYLSLKCAIYVFTRLRVTSKSPFSLLISFLKCDVGAAAQGIDFSQSP